MKEFVLQFLLVELEIECTIGIFSTVQLTLVSVVHGKFVRDEGVRDVAQTIYFLTMS